MKKFKIPYLNLLPILLIAFLLFKLVNNTQLTFSGVFATVYSCIAYFVAGFVVAYILNPAVNFFEVLIRSKKDSPKVKKVKRAAVIAFIYLLMIGIVAVFVVAIIPTIRDAVLKMMDTIPQYADYVESWLLDFSDDLDPQVYGSVETWIDDGFKVLYNWLHGLDISSLGSALTSGVSSVVVGFIRAGFGFIVSIYFLYSKERLILGVKKLSYALFDRERAEKLFVVGRKIHNIFMNFIVSKLLQSLVMFILGLLVLVPLQVPYAPLIALLISITNMIPYFGPFFGAVFCIILVLFDTQNLLPAVWVLVYVLGAQILDNAVIGPKVVSDQVGISPILVIAGVALGGTFGGVLGMFLGVPIVAVVKLVFYDPYIERKLKERQIDVRE